MSHAGNPRWSGFLFWVAFLSGILVSEASSTHRRLDVDSSTGVNFFQPWVKRTCNWAHHDPKLSPAIQQCILSKTAAQAHEDHFNTINNDAYIIGLVFDPTGYLMPIINFVFTTYLQNACLRFNEAKTQDDVDQVLFGESISQPPPKAVQGTILTGGKKLEMRRVLNDKLANRKVYLKSFEKPFSETTANFLVRPDVVPARIKTYMINRPKTFKFFSTAVFSVVKFLQPVLGALEALASIPYLGTFFRLLHDLIDALLLGYRTFQHVTDSVCTLSSPLYAALSFINTLSGFLQFFWFIFSAKYLKVECDTACNAARAEADAVMAMCMAEVPKNSSMARNLNTVVTTNTAAIQAIYSQNEAALTRVTGLLQGMKDSYNFIETSFNEIANLTSALNLALDVLDDADTFFTAIEGVYNDFGAFGAWVVSISDQLSFLNCDGTLICDLADEAQNIIKDEVDNVLTTLGLPSIEMMVSTVLKAFNIPVPDFARDLYGAYMDGKDYIYATTSSWLNYTIDAMDALVLDELLTGQKISPYLQSSMNGTGGVVIIVDNPNPTAQYTCPNGFYPLVTYATFESMECTVDLGPVSRTPCKSGLSSCNKTYSEDLVGCNNPPDNVTANLFPDGANFYYFFSSYICENALNPLPLLGELVDIPQSIDLTPRTNADGSMTTFPSFQTPAIRFTAVRNLQKIESCNEQDKIHIEYHTPTNSPCLTGALDTMNDPYVSDLCSFLATNQGLSNPSLASNWRYQDVCSFCDAGGFIGCPPAFNPDPNLSGVQIYPGGFTGRVDCPKTQQGYSACQFRLTDCDKVNDIKEWGGYLVTTFTDGFGDVLTYSRCDNVCSFHDSNMVTRNQEAGHRNTIYDLYMKQNFQTCDLSSCEGQNQCDLTKCKPESIQYSCIQPYTPSVRGANYTFVYTTSKANTGPPLSQQLRPVTCPSPFNLRVLNLEAQSSVDILTISKLPADDLCPVGQNKCTLSQRAVIPIFNFETGISLSLSGPLTIRATYGCLCPKGFEPFPAISGVASSCMRCGNGTVRGDFDLACQPCDRNGTYAAADGSACLPCRSGTFSKSTGNSILDCILCPAGSYSKAGSTSCDMCPVNTYSNVNGSADGCFDCAPGSETLGLEGARNCTLCSFGTYRATGMDSCQKVPEGFYAPKSGASSPLSCPRGTYSSVEGASLCVPCPIGTYSDSEGAVACQSCPMGYTTTNKSSTSALKCNVDIITQPDPEEVVYPSIMSCEQLLTTYALNATKNNGTTIQSLLAQVGNGVCNYGPWNTKACKYDGGDCCHESCSTGYLSVYANHSRWKVANISTWSPFNFSLGGAKAIVTPINYSQRAYEYSCSFPRFKCMDPAPVNKNPFLDTYNEAPKVGYKNPKAKCSPVLMNNGYCNEDQNSEECDYDGGDCCQTTCLPNPGILRSCAKDTFKCRDPRSSIKSTTFLKPKSVKMSISDYRKGYAKLVKQITRFTAAVNVPYNPKTYSIVYNDSVILPGSCTGNFTRIRSWVAKDLSAKTTSTTVQYVNVSDSKPPMFPALQVCYWLSASPSPSRILLADVLRGASDDSGDSPQIHFEGCSGTSPSLTCSFNSTNGYLTFGQANQRSSYSLRVTLKDTCQTAVTSNMTVQFASLMRPPLPTAGTNCRPIPIARV